jgi:methylthioribose-1-phosphate isomerase
LAARDALSAGEPFHERLAQATRLLAASRPTAVNLFFALDRMRARSESMRNAGADPQVITAALLVEAIAIHDEDRAMCRAIGQHGAALLPDRGGVLTHCNAGALATSEFGTALGVITAAYAAGKKLEVFVDETRPLLQGARLTAWELTRAGIPATLICDNMAAQVMAEGRVQAVVVGADRIAANGDTANKIGTYGVAVLAHAHGIPFHVAAPVTTFDLKLADGAGIPIEQRHADEVTHHGGQRFAPPGVAVYNPAFDVTPARYIASIITDRGVIRPVNEERVRAVVGGR